MCHLRPVFFPLQPLCRSSQPCEREGGGGAAAGTVPRGGGGRGGGAETTSSRGSFSSNSSRISASQPQDNQEPGEPIPEPSPSEEEPSPAQGLLKRRVETKEHREEQVRQREAEQRDFRNLLGRRVTTKSVSEEDLKENTAEQMDFRANLNRAGVKPKTQSEDERKVNAPQQVDFRAVLAKKAPGAAAGPKPGAAPAPEGDSAKNADFRSVLANKKKPSSPEKNGEGPPVAKDIPAASEKEKEKNAVNCVDGGIIEKKSNGTGKEPAFPQKLSDVTVLDGERLRLQCQVTSDPPAAVTWTLDGKVIKPSKFIILANDGKYMSTCLDPRSPSKTLRCLSETERISSPFVDTAGGTAQSHRNAQY